MMPVSRSLCKRDIVTQGEGQPPQRLDDWDHSWINERLVVEGGEATQPGEQGWPAVQPGCGHRQYGGAQVIRDGEAQGAEQVETEEVGALSRHLEGECCESLGAVTHSESSTADHANLNVAVTVQILRISLD